jgi:hypothetical protein
MWQNGRLGRTAMALHTNQLRDDRKVRQMSA